MKKFCVLLCCFCLLSSSNIDKDIKKNQAKIANTIKEQDRINKKIQKLGDEITTQNTKINTLIEQIQILEKEIEDNRGRFSEQEKELKATQEKHRELQERDATIQKQITALITQELAFKVIANREQISGAEDMLLEELFNTLSKNAQLQISTLAEEKKILSESILQYSKEITQLQGLIKTQIDKRKELAEGIKKRNKMIEKFQNDIQNYNQKLSQIAQERESLDEILEKLNIRKRDMEERERQKALAQAEEKNKKSLNAPLEVKKVGSSYRQVSTTQYKGKKTIAPLDSYRIEQRFGTYFDPVYKIKVFNEALILNPTTKNANVKNVLEGKVVFAKNTPMLKKVVIIEHPNQMHTIYAHLDKIAPTVRPGLRIPKGYVIGKVNDKLNFEVTIKDRHINPLELIKR